MAADPPRQECGKNSDDVHPAPRRWPKTSDEKPNERGDEKSDTQSTLHESRTFATMFGGPHFRHHRGSGTPLRPQSEADDKTQSQERTPVPGQTGEPGRKRVGQNRVEQCALAADIVRKNTADDSSNTPGQQRYRNGDTGIEGNGRVLLRRQQLLERG